MQKPLKTFYAPIPAETERIGKLVLDAAFKVHTVLGPGLLESVYGGPNETRVDYRRNPG
jgi:hypothetical protein